MKDNKVNEFEIEKDIPIPAKGTALIKYPLGKLEVGDSILVRFNKDVPNRKTIYKVRSAIAYYYLNNENVKFVTRTVTEGIRVWRIK